MRCGTPGRMEHRGVSSKGAVHVGLVNPSMQSGVFVNSAPAATYAELDEEGRSPQSLEAMTEAMGPPEEYAPLLGPNAPATQSPRRTLVWSFGLVALAAVALLFACEFDTVRLM